MIEILVKTESSQPAEFVMHYNGTGMEMLRSHNGFRTNIPSREKREMKMCKSFTLGIYPKNLWWQDD